MRLPTRSASDVMPLDVGTRISEWYSATPSFQRRTKGSPPASRTTLATTSELSNRRSISPSAKATVAAAGVGNTETVTSVTPASASSCSR